MAVDLDVHPAVFYTGDAVLKSSRGNYAAIQRALTERALELVGLDPRVPRLVLDVGCGSATSGGVIAESGHFFCGVDIAHEMLLHAAARIGDGSPHSLARADAGLGLPFRPGVFGAAVGIDVLQWLFREYPGHAPVAKRLRNFFESLHGCLQCGGRAAFNFAPRDSEQAEMLSVLTTRCGFGGGIRIDSPESPRARIAWLVLEVGGVVPDEVEEAFAPAGCPVVPALRPKKGGKDAFNRKEWILKKKERQKKLGQKVANDSKYTGRSRRRWN
jgi:18S rRNA (guanine1575-N7)-methyltransferase